ncbi:MAG: hypothetical protein ACKVT1_12110 [Dehalococcoidia bacterium]
MLSRSSGAFFAGCGSITPLLPVLCAAASACVYVNNPGWIFDDAYGRQAALGLVLGIALWALAAVTYSFRTSAATANPRVYLDLVSRTGDLDTALIRHLQQEAPGNQAATREVGRLQAEIVEIRRILGVSLPAEIGGEDEELVAAEARPFSSRIHWLLGTAYIELYRRLHVIDADTLLFCSPPELKTAAVTDHFRLTNSQIPGHATWQYHLDQAVTALGADASTFFAPSTPAQAAPGAARLATRVAGQAQTSADDARFLLRAVRRGIDDYRDTLFEGIVRQRGRTMWALFATGAAGYLVLLLSILGRVERENVLGAAILFLVGAVVGLVNRLALVPDPASEIEDYGLSTVRLLQTVVVSGLSAILGVVVVAYAAAAAANATGLPADGAVVESAAATATPAPAQAAATQPAATATVEPPATTTPAAARPVNVVVETPSLERLFRLQAYPFSIVIAAVFGLAPTLLLRRLESTADRLKLDIKRIDNG